MLFGWVFIFIYVSMDPYVRFRVSIYAILLADVQVPSDTCRM